MKIIIATAALLLTNVAFAEPGDPVEKPLQLVYSVGICRAQTGENSFLGQGFTIGVPVLTAAELQSGVDKSMPVNVTASDGERFGGTIRLYAKEYLPNTPSASARIAIKLSYISPEGKR